MFPVIDAGTFLKHSWFFSWSGKNAISKPAKQKRLMMDRICGSLWSWLCATIQLDDRGHITEMCWIKCLKSLSVLCFLNLDFG